jgi:hypothetical protein
MLRQAIRRLDKRLSRIGASYFLPRGVPIFKEAIYRAARLGVMDVVFGQDGLK